MNTAPVIPAANSSSFASDVCRSGVDAFDPSPEAEAAPSNGRLLRSAAYSLIRRSTKAAGRSNRPRPCRCRHRTLRCWWPRVIWPGVLAGALLAFALSIDDFVISNFVNGTTTTFPLWVYGAVKTGIPPQVFAFGTIIFSAGILIAVLSLVLQRKKS